MWYRTKWDHKMGSNGTFPWNCSTARTNHFADTPFPPPSHGCAYTKATISQMAFLVGTAKKSYQSPFISHHSLLERCLRSVHRRVVLHLLLQLEAKLGYGCGSIGEANLVQGRNAFFRLGFGSLGHLSNSTPIDRFGSSVSWSAYSLTDYKTLHSTRKA